MFRSITGLKSSRAVLLGKNFTVKAKSISSSAVRSTDRKKVVKPVNPRDEMGPIDLFVYKEV